MNANRVNVQHIFAMCEGEVLRHGHLLSLDWVRGRRFADIQWSWAVNAPPPIVACCSAFAKHAQCQQCSTRVSKRKSSSPQATELTFRYFNRIATLQITTQQLHSASQHPSGLLCRQTLRGFGQSSGSFTLSSFLPSFFSIKSVDDE